MPDPWNCSQCTLENAAESLACSMCGTLRQNKSGWYCVHCTFHNVSTSLICTACHRTQPQSPPHSLFPSVFKHRTRRGVSLPKPPRRRMHHSSGNGDNPLLQDEHDQKEEKERESTEIMDETEEEHCIIWICTHCTFANNQRHHWSRCELCNGLRIQTLDQYQSNREEHDDDDGGDERKYDNDPNDHYDHHHFYGNRNRKMNQSRNDPVELAIAKQRPHCGLSAMSNGNGISGIDHEMDSEIKNLSTKMERTMDLDTESNQFTLSQLVHLVTHEKSDDEDAARVLLLCHHCFTDSIKLLQTIRDRFFCSAPKQAAFDENVLIWWCQFTQRPIQNKCIQLLCQWVTHYFRSDFVNQPEVLVDLHEFSEAIYRCRSETSDGWYEALTALLNSAMECAQRQLAEVDLKARFKTEDARVAKQSEDGDKSGEQKKVENLKPLDELLSLDYGINDGKKNQKEAICVEEEEKKCSRKKIYDHSAVEIAEQLTWRDYEYFESIHLREFLDKVWRSNRKETPNLQRFIRRFNRLHQWIMLYIVSAYSLEERVLILGHFIDVGSKLAEMGNFFSMMALYGAIDCVSVCKLRYCWLRLDKKHKATKERLAKMCSGSNNFKSLRKRTKEYFADSRPTIPYIGVFLRDLTFVNEGAAKLVEGFINFKRFQSFAERCKIIECYQRIPYPDLTETVLCDQIQGDVDAFNDCLKETAVRQLVNDAVKRDEKSATKGERAKIEMGRKAPIRRKSLRRNS